MKIESLSFKNINSLKGEHKVHFDESPLNSGGLFAIIGPTGSGKSSLLDAICLGLYGRTPRISSVTKSKIEQDGSILTKYQKEAYAKVKFSCNLGTYEATWSISTNRNNKLRECEMDLWNVATEISFSEKKTEVLAEVERLIGLSYDQFVKSVLLSQGDFATLLQSNEKERSELLEKITNTSIYRSIGKKVYEKYMSLKSKILTQKTILDNLQDKLISKETESDFKENLNQLKEKETIERKKLSEYQKDLDQLTLKEKLSSEENVVKTDLKTLLDHKQSFDNENQHKLEQHQKTLEFEDELQEFNSLQKDGDRLKASITREQEEITKINSNINSLHQKTEDLLKTKVEPQAVESELEKLQETHTELNTRRSSKLHDFSAKKQLLNKELEGLDLKFQKQELDSFIGELTRKSEISSEQIQNLEKELKDVENLEKRIQEQEHLRDTLKEAAHESRILKDLGDQLLRLENKRSILHKKKSEYPEQIKLKESKFKTAEKELDHLQTKKENQNLRLEVEDLRQKLQKDEPCPVCGAIDHPYSEHLPEVISDLDKTIAKAKEIAKQLSRDLQHLNAEFSSLVKQIEDLNKEANELHSKRSLNQEEFDLKFKELNSLNEGESYANLEQKTRQTIENYKAFKQYKVELKALQSSISILEELLDIQKEGKSISEKMKSLYKGDDLGRLVTSYTKSWNQLHTELKSVSSSLDKQTSDKAVLNNNLSQLQQGLKSMLEGKGFANIAEANASRMKSSNYNELLLRKSDIVKNIKVKEEKLEGLENQLKSLEFVHFTEKDKTEIAIDNIKVTLNSTREKLEDIKRVLNNQKENLTEYKTIQDSIIEVQKANKKWEVLNRLIGDATGTEFNKFAQDLSLQRLILLGNKRLNQLNDRYELDRFIAGEDKNQLYVIDNHMGGLRRSVKTLSGGETFLMSLALALGLSDLASKNVEINSLFIDEGFGTLDPETLDLTLDTLERLQAESNKTIGIISHVNALKERIQTQIVLNRNTQGYSQLEVIS
ncbi:exonuclease complex subunit SbcC [Psychroflexus torquis ATCC 700755]|uniref:Exonuclease complex subunit SbcC n=1 Tax=Psychroflexus torquis (strain ATCC 700755 / CIP 106069 / ACAM 623) TaxID=313595 RepID=K4II12_PSYTT|nr:AAA family ATPase [Psychroflexus torquis]AFU70187.1 exonuclease complex subunit SbcC [Psychroflexus torquis ATCC 700755]